MPNQTDPTIENQLAHLEAEYRYLSQASYAWNKVFANPPEDLQKKLNSEFAELSTIIQDSLLLHTRNLLEFYLNQPRRDDIKLRSLIDGSKLSEIEDYINDDSDLKNLKKQIEVHALHLTYYRSLAYREDDGQEEIKRPNFNYINGIVFDKMLHLLKMLIDGLEQEHQVYLSQLNELYDQAKDRSEKGSDIEWKSVFDLNHE